MSARLLACAPLLFTVAACGSASSDDTGGDTGGESSGSTGTSTGAPTPTTGEATSSGATTSETTTTTTASTGDDSSSGSSGDDSSSGGSSGDSAEPVVDPWLRSFGAPDSQRPGGLGFTADGALWVAGDVIGALDLGAGPLAGDGSGIYLARYGEHGDTVHAQALFAADGQPTLTTVSGLAVDGTGAVVVTGWLEGSYTIGGVDLVADEIDVFVGKWDVDGAPVWGRKFGEADWQVGYAVAVGPGDRVWVAGAALAPFMAGDIMLGGAASTGMFLLGLDGADGAPTYGRWWGEMGDQEARAVAVCSDGSLALAGFLTAPLTFAGDDVDSVGAKDMFVAHLDADGEPLWMRALGSAATDIASHVQCGDDVLFAGTVAGAVQIGDLELTPAGDADAVLGRYDFAGALTWSAGLTGPEDQLPAGLGRDQDGTAFIAVTTTGATTLGPQTVDGAGDRDVLLARYAPDAADPAAVVLLGDDARQTAGPLAIDSSGAAALAISHAGAIAWDGLPSVAATGEEDLALLRWVPGPL